MRPKFPYKAPKRPKSWLEYCEEARFRAVRNRDVLNSGMCLNPHVHVGVNEIKEETLYRIRNIELFIQTMNREIEKERNKKNAPNQAAG